MTAGVNPRLGLSRLLARLLGMEMKLRQYERGKFFCDAVVRARGADSSATCVLEPLGAANASRAGRPDGMAGPNRARRRPEHQPALDGIEAQRSGLDGVEAPGGQDSTA